MAKKSKANHAEPDGMWIALRHSTNMQKEILMVIDLVASRLTAAIWNWPTSPLE